MSSMQMGVTPLYGMNNTSVGAPNEEFVAIGWFGLATPLSQWHSVIAVKRHQINVEIVLLIGRQEMHVMCTGFVQQIYGGLLDNRSTIYVYVRVLCDNFIQFVWGSWSNFS
jgi:hypothetical protein